MDWINYQHLFYLWHIGHYGSVTKAAEKLRLAQPTISAQMRTLEDSLGERLFEKRGRNIYLTEAGNIAFKYAERIFSLGQELKDTLSGTLQLKPKELRIGLLDAVPKILAFRILKPAFHRFKELTVTCTEGNFESLLSELAQGELDLLISDRPTPPGGTIKAYSHFVGESSISFLSTAKIKRKLKNKFPLNLDNANIILPSNECLLHNQLVNWFEKLRIRPKVIAYFQDTAIMKIVASDGIGIIPIPTIIAKEVCKEYSLKNIGTTNDVKEPIYLISLERRLKNQALVDIFKSGTSVLTDSK